MLATEIAELVKMQLGIADVRATDRLLEDLGAESADALNLVAALEDRYGILVEEDEIPDLRTVADMVALVRERG